MLFSLLQQHDLHISPRKCQVVVFARKNAWPKASWHVEGKPLERVDAFKYLGVMLHGSSSIGKTVDHRLQLAVCQLSTSA
jgi:hypothetical protein